MEIRRTFDLLDNYAQNFADKKDALASKANGKFEPISAQEYIQNSHYIAYGLLALGLQQGDKVATISNNRVEWNYLDMGMSMTGVIHVPIYPTISDDEYNYILNHCQPKVIIVSDAGLYKRLKPLSNAMDFIKNVYCINNVADAPNYTEILSAGKTNEAVLKPKVQEIKNTIKEEAPTTILYTSGTTGNPKGVLLSHLNLVSNFTETVKAHNLGSECRVLSFLPINHIYERSLNYHYQLKGMGIYYAESMATIVDNLKEVKPHMITTVPRLLERIYDKIIGKGKDLKGIKKRIFFWAVELGLRFERNNANGAIYALKLKIAQKLVFNKWLEALGGNMNIIVTGGAAIQPRLCRVFSAAGIKLLEGYGLTETSPVIAVGNPVRNEIMFGTVGPILDRVNVKIADDGEILCKGPGVMMGYYNEPQLTKEVIDEDGYFHTGDIGNFIDNKYLKITDRKKEIFKLSSGKYVAPQMIENKLKESFFIEQVMVIGDGEKFASALIAPNFSFLHNWCYLHKLKFRDNSDLIKMPQVIERYQKEVNAINKQLGQTEQIKRIRLVHDEWTPQNGMLSPTLKLKRKNINLKYGELMQEIYSVQKNT